MMFLFLKEIKSCYVSSWRRATWKW